MPWKPESVRLPGTKIPAHWHPTDENVTVLKGIFQVGTGEKFDRLDCKP
jgi:hypothetical protein